MAAGAPGLWSRPAARHLRAVDDDRLSSLLLRRRRRCRRPALPPALAPLPRVEHRRYLYAAVPPPHAGGGRAGGGTDQRGRSRRRVGRPEHAEAGILDGRARRTARRGGTDWRRRRLRLSRRPEAAAAALDAAVRAGMAVPPRHRAATAVEAISDEQSGVRLAGDPGALACSSPAAGTQRPRSRPAACAGGAPRQVMSRSAAAGGVELRDAGTPLLPAFGGSALLAAAVAVLVFLGYAAIADLRVALACLGAGVLAAWGLAAFHRPRMAMVVSFSLLLVAGTKFRTFGDLARVLPRAKRRHGVRAQWSPRLVG